MNALEQRRSALEVANRVRMAGARVKNDLSVLDKAAGRRLAAELVDDWFSQDPLPALSAQDLLAAIHRVGPSSISKFCRGANVNPQRRVSDFTKDQRTKLVRLLEKDAARIEREQSQRAKGRRYGS